MNVRNIFNELKEGMLAWDEYNNRKNNLKITKPVITSSPTTLKSGVATGHSPQEDSKISEVRQKLISIK